MSLNLNKLKIMQLVDYFREFKFNPVALPSGDIDVFQILLRSNGVLERLGDKAYIDTLFETESKSFSLYATQNIAVPDISGTHNQSTDVKVHLAFLETLVKYLGTQFGFDLTKNSSDELVFAFESPKMDSIPSIPELEEYLNKAVLKSTNPYAKRLKNSEIYIITSVLKTTNFAVGLVDKNKLATGLKIPSIKDFIEGDLTIGTEGGSQRVMKYKGDQPLVFAVKAVKVQHKQTLWQEIFDRKGEFFVILEEGLVVKGTENVKYAVLESDKPLMF